MIMSLFLLGPSTGVCRLDWTGLDSSHLGLDVVERWRADDGEADQEDVGLGV